MPSSAATDRWGKGCRHKHGDYFTTEYAAGMQGTSKAWEENRGIGHSYGYNRNEALDDYRSARSLILTLVDMVSRGGNLLLDMGPTGDGRIPVIMEERLIDLGKWLRVNGEAIYATRPWRNNAQWSEGKKPTVKYGGQYMVKYNIDEVTGDRTGDKAVVEAFFTAKGDSLFAISPRYPGTDFTIKNVAVSPSTQVSLLGFDKLIKWLAVEKDVVIQVPNVSGNKAITQKILTFKITGVK